MPGREDLYRQLVPFIDLLEKRFHDPILGEGPIDPLKPQRRLEGSAPNQGIRAVWTGRKGTFRSYRTPSRSRGALSPAGL